MHFCSGSSEFQKQVGRVTEGAVVVDRETTLEVAYFRALQQIFILQYAVMRLTWFGIEPQDFIVRFGAAAGEHRDAPTEHNGTHDFTTSLIPQQKADLVVEGVHRLFAMAPRGHAVMKAP